MKSSLQAKVDHFEQQRRAFLQRMEQFSPAQIEFRPHPDHWSILQVIEHLVLSEEGTFRIVEKQLAHPKLPQNGLRLWPLRAAVMKSVLRMPLRFKIPTEQVRPQATQSYEELIRRWDAVREHIQTLAADLPPEKEHLLVFRHAFFGKLTFEQVIEFCSEHFRHHMHQIRRIEKAPGFAGIATAKSHTQGERS